MTPETTPETIEIRLFVFGLDRAGKTTTIARLQENQFAPQRPTLGVNITQIVMGNIKFNVVDVGGQKHLRGQWEAQIKDPHLLVFVVDCTDTDDRLAEAREELFRILLLDKTADIPLLFLENKGDLEAARPSAEIRRRTGWNDVVDRPKHHARVSAKTGAGIPESLNWITSAAMRDARVEVFVDAEIQRRVKRLRSNLKELLAKVKGARRRKNLEEEYALVGAARDVAEKFYELGVFGGKRQYRKLSRRADKLRKKLDAS